MGKRVAILGNLSEGDLERIESIARVHNFELTVIGKGETENITDPSQVPAAYISFIPSTPAAIMDMFATLPIGTGERIPYFQCVDAEVHEYLKDLPITGFFASPLSMPVIHSVFRTVERNSTQIELNRRLSTQIADIRAEMVQLVDIGTALSHEDDLKILLSLILTLCRQAVFADAGSVYIRERNVSGGVYGSSLIFSVSQNDSIEVGESTAFKLPIDENSIAGYVAFSGNVLNIADTVEISPDVPYRTSATFRNHFGYHAKSMLTVPLKNLKNEVVGVLQLINRKKEMFQQLNDGSAIDEFTTPFSFDDEAFVLSVASMAAVSIERAQLHEDITTLFEGFLNASIASIDERDRVTSGHSRRVMGYAMAFVDAAEAEPGHPYAVLAASKARKRQFQFAALLHDIGKIGVPESILNKNRRLPEREMDLVMAKIDYVALRRIIEPDSVSWKSSDELEDDREFLLRINKSGFITDEEVERLTLLKEKKFVDLRGAQVSLLSDYAFESLAVRRGNLTRSERIQINSHALSTNRILSQIPWTSSLVDVPVIAAQHHEKLDGSGYPAGLTGDQMFLESKILAVIDIYEALVAQDRPYKPKMEPEKALRILHEEVKASHLDEEIVNFFIEKNIYKKYTDTGAE
jgi:HD-GYP domain-containing protein (c-di-GMP phosphodiesterase class II)